MNDDTRFVKRIFLTDNGQWDVVMGEEAAKIYTTRPIAYGFQLVEDSGEVVFTFLESSGQDGWTTWLVTVNMVDEYGETLYKGKVPTGQTERIVATINTWTYANFVRPWGNKVAPVIN